MSIAQRLSVFRRLFLKLHPSILNFRGVTYHKAIDSTCTLLPNSQIVNKAKETKAF